MRKFRLEIELMPSSVWRSSLYLLLHREVWRKTKQEIHAEEDANATFVVLRKEDFGVTMHAFLRGEIRFFKFDVANTKTYMGACSSPILCPLIGAFNG